MKLIWGLKLLTVQIYILGLRYRRLRINVMNGEMKLKIHFSK